MDQRATVDVGIISAQGLNLQRLGNVIQPSLFAILGTSKKSLKKTHIVKDNNPKFDVSYKIAPESPLDDVVVGIWGKDGEYDVFVGQAVISLLTISDGEEMSALFSLSTRTTDPPELQVSGEVHLRLSFTYPETWGCVYDGVHAFETGEFERAIHFFSLAIQAFPEEYMLWGFRSAARNDALEFVGAREDATKVIELQPNRAEGYLRLGNVYLSAADDFQNAKECYLTALKLEPNHELTIEALREMDQKRKLSRLKKVVNEGVARFNEGSFQSAGRLFDEAIELNKKNVIYHVYKTLSLIAAGEASASDVAATIVRVDSAYPKDNPILSGYMQKRGTGVSVSWKSRYFVLKERFLWYYKNHTDIFPIDVILLGGFKVSCYKKGDVRFSVELPRRTYQLKCATKRDRDGWMSVLQGISLQSVTLPKEKLVFFHESPAPIMPNLGKKNRSKTVKTIPLVGAVHTGFLFKEGRFNTAAKLRWFVVRDRTLYYFQRKELVREAPYYGSISLQGIQLTVTDATSFSLIDENRVWNLRAETPEEAKEWTDVLRLEIYGNVVEIEEEENEENLERSRRKLEAQREFSDPSFVPVEKNRSTVMIPQKDPKEVAGFGDMLSNETEPLLVKDERATYHTGKDIDPRKLKKKQNIHTGYTSSELRYFERLGLPIPEDDDPETAIKNSDLEFDPPTDDLGEMLGKSVQIKAKPKRRNEEDEILRQQELQRRRQEEEDEEGCCDCVIL